MRIKRINFELTIDNKLIQINKSNKLINQIPGV